MCLPDSLLQYNNQMRVLLENGNMWHKKRGNKKENNRPYKKCSYLCIRLRRHLRSRVDICKQNGRVSCNILRFLRIQIITIFTFPFPNNNNKSDFFSVKSQRPQFIHFVFTKKVNFFVYFVFLPLHSTSPSPSKPG